VTRRRFLRLLAIVGLSGTAAVLVSRTRQIRRLGDPGRSTVAVVRCDGYGADLTRRVERAWTLGRGPDVRDRTVVLKPNLVDHTPGLPINTDPRFIAALVDVIRGRGARNVIVAEGPGNRRDVWTVLEDCGLAEQLALRGVRFVDLNTDDPVRVSTTVLPGRVASLIPHLFLPRTIARADLVVSVAKLKTHHWSGVTLAMKNLFGVVPGAIYGWPKNLLHWNGIDRSVLELVRTVRPGFGMVDGIVGMEGDGPLLGPPLEAGLILSGRDLVALDATASVAMGVVPERIAYLDAADELGMGRVDAGHIDRAGDPLEPHIRRFVLPAGFEALRG
jgi:uncharacterized protein (DUF362 family)